MDLSEASVVRDVVISTPGATVAFDRFHVDYCCGGGSTLAEACARAGAAVADVLAAIREESARPGAQVAGGEMLAVPLAQLAAHLREVHHARSRAAATALLAQAREVARSDGRAELARIRDELAQLFGALLPHLDFEERYIFPYAVAVEQAFDAGAPRPVALFESIAETVREMEREHQACDRALHAIHALASGLAHDPSEPVRALVAALDAHERDLVRHMHLEGNVLLPRTERLEQKFVAPGRRGRAG